MPRTISLVISIALAALLAGTSPRPAGAQSGQVPQAWLFGAWTGGVFPPPSSFGAQECLAQPVVIFTRDVVMRATVTDVSYIQRVIETARGTGTGVDFHFTQSPPTAPQGPFNLSVGGSNDVGFGCASPDELHVQRRSENEISFPNCKDFPYPLVRCPGR